MVIGFIFKHIQDHFQVFICSLNPEATVGLSSSTASLCSDFTQASPTVRKKKREKKKLTENYFLAAINTGRSSASALHGEAWCFTANRWFIHRIPTQAQYHHHHQYYYSFLIPTQTALSRCPSARNAIRKFTSVSFCIDLSIRGETCCFTFPGC